MFPLLIFSGIFINISLDILDNLIHSRKKIKESLRRRNLYIDKYLFHLLSLWPNRTVNEGKGANHGGDAGQDSELVDE